MLAHFEISSLHAFLGFSFRALGRGDPQSTKHTATGLKMSIWWFILADEFVSILKDVNWQTELERERIALELEEEKKAQAEWEKRVQEQAKKIENLSSMVLYSTRDENRDHNKKVCTMLVYRVFTSSSMCVSISGASECPLWFTFIQIIFVNQLLSCSWMNMCCLLAPLATIQALNLWCYIFC